MKFKRLVLMLICVGLVLGGFAACADGKKPGYNGDKEKPVYDDSSRETAKDSIPDDYSLEGQKVGIFYAAHVQDQIIGNSELEDIVYKRIYERNQKVAWRLDCELDFIPGGKVGDWEAFTPDLNLKVGTMDDSFWIVMSTNNTIIQNKMFDRFHDMNNSTYVDLEREWWYKDAIMECSVDGYYYRFLYGDITLSSMGNNGAIYYNKELYAQYVDPGNPEGLYDEVLAGTWTFERFSNVVNESYVNYGGVNDIHGFTLIRYGEPLHYFPVSCGIEFYRRDSTGRPIECVNNDKAKDFAVELHKLLYNNEGTKLLYFPNKLNEEKGQPQFTDGKFIFSLGSLLSMLTPEMREMDADFGVLPYPKWEKEQEEYITMNANGSVLVGCTKNVPIEIVEEEAGAVIEALASESYRSVSLAFYEDALQRAYSRDDTTARMIDIICGQDKEIKSRVTKNFLYEYASSIGNAGVIFQHIMINNPTGNPDFGSAYAALGNTQLRIDELFEKYISDSIS